MSKLKLGLIGLGTVGCGVYKTVEELDNVEIVKVAVKNYLQIIDAMMKQKQSE